MPASMADDSEDPSLQVDVKVNADTAGAQQATEALRGVGAAGAEAGEKAGKGFGEAGKGLREVLVNSRHAHEVFEGIEKGAQGGVGGIMAMVRGFRALFVLIAEGIGATGLGGLLLVLGAVGGAMLALTGKSKETADALQETGKHAEDAKKRVDEMAAAKLDALKKETDDLEKSFERLDKAIESAKKHVSEMNQATNELETAQTKQRQQGENVALEKKFATGAISKTDYDTEKAALDQRHEFELKSNEERQKAIELDGKIREAKNQQTIDLQKQSALAEDISKYDQVSAESSAKKAAAIAKAGEALDRYNRATSDETKNKFLGEFGEAQDQAITAESEDTKLQKDVAEKRARAQDQIDKASLDAQAQQETIDVGQVQQQTLGVETQTLDQGAAAQGLTAQGTRRAQIQKIQDDAAKKVSALNTESAGIREHELGEKGTRVGSGDKELAKEDAKIDSNTSKANEILAKMAADIAKLVEQGGVGADKKKDDATAASDASKVKGEKSTGRGGPPDPDAVTISNIRNPGDDLSPVVGAAQDQTASTKALTQAIVEAHQSSSDALDSAAAAVQQVAQKVDTTASQLDASRSYVTPSS